MQGTFLQAVYHSIQILLKTKNKDRLQDKKTLKNGNDLATDLQNPKL